LGGNGGFLRALQGIFGESGERQIEIRFASGKFASPIWTPRLDSNSYRLFNRGIQEVEMIGEFSLAER